MNRITLCFVSLYAYSLFNESSQYIFGGSEVRAVLFGVGLSKFPEYNVSFVVFDHQQPKVEEYGRVKVYRHSYYRSGEDHQCNVALTASLSSQARVDTLSGLGPGDTAPADVRRCKAAVPGYMRKARRELGLFIQKTPLAVSMAMLKALMRRSRRTNAQTSTTANGGESMAAAVGKGRRTDTSDIYNIYKEIDADVYCIFGVNTFVAEVAEFCKTFGKKLILFIGSDIDLDLAYHNNDKYIRDILNQSDVIITQNLQQSKTVQDTFKKKSVTIKNPIELRTDDCYNSQLLSRERALWIGKSDRIKRPEILLKLAERFQNVPFLMILNRAHPEIFEQIIQNKPPNVEVVERVSFQHIETLFAKALIIINTSAFEGFPNTFLQAGKYGVPILSLNVDPDSFIERQNCGVFANGNFDRFVDGFYNICFDKNKWNSFSENIKRYVKDNHELHEKILELRQIIGSFSSIHFKDKKYGDKVKCLK